MSNPTVIFQNLTIGYKQKGSSRKEVAKDINACLMPGELTCLIGPNGVGKSTLFKTIAGFTPPLEGTILINGKTSLSPKEKSKQLGIVLTSQVKLHDTTVREIVAIGRSPYTGFWGKLSSSDEEIINRAMEDIGISSMQDRQITTLSDGERQKVMIAKALAQETPIIILDEPTAFLDYPSKVETMQLLHRLCKERNKSIILSTHDVEIALQMADTLWILNDSKISIGTPKELADKGIISSFIERKNVRFNTENLSIRIENR